jgi:hypothetical protein
MPKNLDLAVDKRIIMKSAMKLKGVWVSTALSDSGYRAVMDCCDSGNETGGFQKTRGLH